jgi:hypothetical protein
MGSAKLRIQLIDLFFKIVLPVLMIGIVTVAAHRWGPAVGGVLGAVPAKGGPILLFLAIEQSPAFAATAAVTALGGAAGCGVFCLVYARVCHRTTWPIAALASYSAFLVIWAAMIPLERWGLLPAFVATAAILVASRQLLPAAAPTPGKRKMSRTDLPSRMIAGAGMVVFVTTVGPIFGATISGMLTTIPTIAAVLAIFTHAQEGPDRTVGVMRGITHGLLGFASFLAVVGVTIESRGIVVGFALALAAVVVVQAVELRSAFALRHAPSADESLLPEAAE